ncbi:MAG: nodulation protein NfeD [Bacteroidia bacterium]|nr:nodulation protein NfeD [Bacteroidia bacterium]
MNTYKFLKYSLLILLLINISYPVLGQNQDSTVLIYNFKMDKEIAPPMWRITDLAIDEAEKMKADFICIEMNTYGGMLDAADSIRTKILNTDIPVYVFINNNAASAGALISIACDKIYMTSGANIGAATVVDQNAEALPDKYQSYMRSMMRATAEANDRDPQIAEAMVDPDVEVKGISKAGKVLTFTASEAVEHNYCDGIVSSKEEMFASENINNIQFVEYAEGTIDKIIGFLINPMVSGILMLVIIGGLYFELQSPGVGFPILASVTAAVLYFAPLYLEGLAENWEILLFVVGLVLIALEVFVIPGFGVAGVSGIICIVTAFTLSLVNNIGFDFTFVPPGKLNTSLFTVAIAMILSIVPLFFIGKRLLESKLFSKLILADTMESSEGFTADHKEHDLLIGKTGIAYTDLRPAGKIKVDEQIYQAKAAHGYIEKDQEITVIPDESIDIVVKTLSK